MMESLDYARQIARGEGAKAKERQGTRNDIPQNSAESSEQGETRDKVASAVDMSHDISARHRHIVNHKYNIPGRLCARFKSVFS